MPFRLYALTALGLLASLGAAQSLDIDALVAKRMREQRIVGASVGVMIDGKDVVAKGYGVKGVGTTDPVGPDTPFAVGSVTKQFTAACIFRLADQGKLSVHDTLGKYLPQMTSADKITLLDLMNHVAGYPDYFPLDFVDRRMFEPIATQTLAERYGEAALDFAPGTQWSYSNTNFIILSLVIEKVSGQPYGTFLKHEILDPLGMTHSFFAPVQRDASFAQGVTSIFLGPPEAAVREAAGWTGAAGDLHSTAEDLLKWDLALMQGKVMSPSSFALYRMPRRLNNGANTNYACGLDSVVTNGHRVLQHEGEVSGFTAENFLCLDAKSAFVILYNQDMANLGPLNSDLVARVLPNSRGSVAAEASGPSTPVRTPPAVAGESAEASVRRLISELQNGKLDRSKLGDDFSFFLSPERLDKVTVALAPLGKPQIVVVSPPGERGGFAVSEFAINFASARTHGLIYRAADGIVQELLLWKSP